MYFFRFYIPFVQNFECKDGMIICLPILLLLRSSLEMNTTYVIRDGIFDGPHSDNFGNSESVNKAWERRCTV
jgi:hypothetical protein